MSSITLEQIEEQLRQLSPAQLDAVSQFIASLTYWEKEMDEEHRDLLLAAESSLREDCGTPEEDAAWQHL